MMTIGSRDRRALFICAITVAVCATYRYALLPYVANATRARDELTAQRELLARELGMIADVPALTESVKAASTKVLGFAARLFVADRDVNLTAAEMQAYIQELATLASLNVAQLDVEPRDTIAEGLSSVTLRLRGQGDFEGLLTLARSLEEGPKLFAIREILVQQPPGSANTMTPYQVLDYTLRVTGYAVRADTR